jgi:hypothetical protein
MESFCSTEVFRINGVDANEGDFGTGHDEAPEELKWKARYGCGDRQFMPIPPTSKVLTKYGLTEAEYGEIALRLQEQLSFGSCGRCI